MKCIRGEIKSVVEKQCLNIKYTLSNNDGRRKSKLYWAQIFLNNHTQRLVNPIYALYFVKNQLQLSTFKK